MQAYTPGIDSAKPMSYDEILQLLLNINDLPSENLVPVVEIIKLRELPFCKSNAKYLELDLENFKPSTLRELENYIESYLQKKPHGRSKESGKNEELDTKEIQQQVNCSGQLYSNDKKSGQKDFSCSQVDDVAVAPTPSETNNSSSGSSRGFSSSSDITDLETVVSKKLKVEEIKKNSHQPFRHTVTTAMKNINPTLHKSPLLVPVSTASVTPQICQTPDKRKLAYETFELPHELLRNSNPNHFIKDLETLQPCTIRELNTYIQSCLQKKPHDTSKVYTNHQFQTQVMDKQQELSRHHKGQAEKEWLQMEWVKQRKKNTLERVRKTQQQQEEPAPTQEKISPMAPGAFPDLNEREKLKQDEQEKRRREARANQIDINRQSDIMGGFEIEHSCAYLPMW